MNAIRLETIRDLFDIKGMTKEMLRAVLTHPHIAIVDREAELPTHYGEGMSQTAKTGYGMAQREMLKEDWVKGIKDKDVSSKS